MPISLIEEHKIIFDCQKYFEMKLMLQIAAGIIAWYLITYLNKCAKK